MEKKVVKQDLVEGLAARRSISKKKAEAFVHAVFDVIEEGLLADQLVKVKGIGTFKLITVDSRESVNVNTGERIVIESHSKVSFTPDPGLRDHVNRPFADFETVILNDETKTEDMERIDEPETLEEEATIVEVKTEEPLTEKVEEEPVAEVVEEVVEEPVVEPEPEVKVEKPVVKPKPEVKEEMPVAEPKPEVKEKEPVVETPTDDGGDNKGYLWLILILIMVGLAVFFLSRKTEDNDAQQPQQPVVEMPSQSDSIVADAPKTEPETKPEPKPETKPEIDIEECKEKYPQVKYGEYWIVGTKGTHTIQKGDDLSKLALEYYGDKKVISYIIKYNDLKKPSNILVGQEIKLPELTPRKKTTDIINQNN